MAVTRPEKQAWGIPPGGRGIPPSAKGIFERQGEAGESGWSFAGSHTLREEKKTKHFMLADPRVGTPGPSTLLSLSPTVPSLSTDSLQARATGYKPGSCSRACCFLSGWCLYTDRGRLFFSPFYFNKDIPRHYLQAYIIHLCYLAKQLRKRK